MALKNLVVEKNKVTEAAIEELIRDFAGYDIDGRTVVFHPPWAALDNAAKVLVYLAAIKGWPFVVDSKPPGGAAKPGEIEAVTGIPGNTLRPILKRLKEDKVLVVDAGRYSLPSYRIQAARETVAAAAERAEPRNRRSGSRKRTPRNAAEEVTAQHRSGRSKVAKQARKGSGAAATKRPSNEGPTLRIRKLAEEGFFAQPRSLRDVQARLKTVGYTYPLTQLSGKMQVMVRGNMLRREKAKIGSREVYQYTKA